MSSSGEIRGAEMWQKVGALREVQGRTVEAARHVLHSDVGRSKRNEHSKPEFAATVALGDEKSIVQQEDVSLALLSTIFIPD